MKIIWKNYIYEAVMTEAYSKEDIDRLFGEQITNWLKNNNYGNKENPGYDVQHLKQFIINEIINTDPSADKKYLGQITKWLLTKRPEDLTTQIKEYLSRFKKILDIYPGGEVGGISKELSKGKINFDAFKNKVIELEKKFSQTLENPELKANKATSNFKIVGQNENYVCFKIDKWISEKDDKHICFSGDVDWCVKYKEYFDQYSPPYYYFMEKATGKEFALMHIESSQLKDIRDEGLSYLQTQKIIDIIYPILKEYSAGDKYVNFSDDFEVIMSVLGENKNAYRELKMYSTTWFDYVGSGDLEKMKSLIGEYKFDIDIRNQGTETALMIISLDKIYDPVTETYIISNWLIRNGADVNAKTDRGASPIFGACQSKNVEIVRQLLAAGADPNNKMSGISRYAIEYAVFNEKMLKMMLDAGADVNIKADLLLPLVRSNNTSNVDDNMQSAALLLKAGADPNKTDDWGDSAILYAKRHNRPRFYEMFDHFNKTGEVVIPKDEAKERYNKALEDFKKANNL